MPAESLSVPRWTDRGVVSSLQSGKCSALHRHNRIATPRASQTHHSRASIRQPCPPAHLMRSHPLRRRRPPATTQMPPPQPPPPPPPRLMSVVFTRRPIVNTTSFVKQRRSVLRRPCRLTPAAAVIPHTAHRGIEREHGEREHRGSVCNHCGCPGWWVVSAQRCRKRFPCLCFPCLCFFSRVCRGSSK